MDGAIIQQEDDLAEATLDIAQDDQGEDIDGVLGFGLGLEIDGGVAGIQIYRQEAVEFFALLLIARQGRGRVLLCPSVMGTGGGLEREFVQGYESRVGPVFGGFFWSSSTNAARSAGWEGPSSRWAR